MINRAEDGTINEQLPSQPLVARETGGITEDSEAESGKSLSGFKI